MLVRVQLFARARDLAGTDALELVLPEPATVGDLRRRLAQDHPRLAALLERSALAVNEDFADETAAITPDAAVALLPPVSGG